MRVSKTLLKWLILLSASIVTISVFGAEQTDTEKFAQRMAQQYKFDPDFVTSTLSRATKSSSILEAIARPWEAKPWFQYYPIFLTEKRLNKGVEFWLEHEDVLQKAENELGVPAEIIVAIIGVETFYGSYKGKYKVLDALYTLAFYYPPRSKFFTSELEQLFLLSREEGFDLDQLMGSYAGAMGLGQFISSSYRHYAIDFSGDGIRDLLNDPVDAIGSVANYFKKHGWKKGQPVAYQAEISGEKYKNHLSDKLQYQDKWGDLKDAGISIKQDVSIDDGSSAKLFEFKQANSMEYWLALPNFYVITRYNHSPLYAMAVYQLSQQIKQQKLSL